MAAERKLNRTKEQYEVLSRDMKNKVEELKLILQGTNSKKEIWEEIVKNKQKELNELKGRACNFRSIKIN